MVKKTTMLKTITTAAVMVGAAAVLIGCSGTVRRSGIINESAGTKNENTEMDGMDPWEVLKKAPKADGGNKLVSKTSLDSVLALAGIGMSSEAGRADIEKFTGIRLTEGALRQHSADLNNDVVKSANGIFVSNDYELSEDFADLAQRIGMAAKGYHSKEEGLEAVNDFVSTNTDGMIKQAIESSKEVKEVMLVNTLYFDGLWDFIWDSEELAPFYGNKKTEEATLFQKDMSSYYEEDDWYGIRLDYKGGRYSMYAAIPKKNNSNPESKMTKERFKALFQNEVFAEARIFFPAFTFETTSMDMTGIVKDMCPGAFKKLDLVASNSAKLDNILQKTKIEVTKEGTRAAAVTVGNVITDSIMMSEPKEIRFDHPFVFAIIDTETGADLFNGVLKTIP